MANGLGMLLEAPDQHRLLLDNPELIPSAVEEILRYESPLQIGNRLTSQEVTLTSGTIPKDTYIHTSIAGANRGPGPFLHNRTRLISAESRTVTLRSSPAFTFVLVQR